MTREIGIISKNHLGNILGGFLLRRVILLSQVWIMFISVTNIKGGSKNYIFETFLYPSLEEQSK